MPMNLGLGLGLSRRAASGAPAFSPASLFAASEPGFWGRVQTSDLWQDVARTTPVTATGQEVLSWRLRTSGADIYATQATAGTGPIYRIDADSRPYLDFSSNKWLVTSAVNGSGSDKSQLFAAYRANNNGNRMLIETSTNVDLVNGATFFLVQGTDTNTLKYFSKGTSFADPTSPSGTLRTLKRYATGLGDISGDLAILREMGVETARQTVDQGTGNYGNHVVYIGSRGGVTFPFNDSIYGLILRYGPNLSEEQIANTEAWMAALINP